MLKAKAELERATRARDAGGGGRRGGDIEIGVFFFFY